MFLWQYDLPRTAVPEMGCSFLMGGEGLGHLTKYFCSFHSKHTKFRDPEILLGPMAQNFLQVPHLVKKYKKPRKNLDFLYLVGGEGLEPPTFSV